MVFSQGSRLVCMVKASPSVAFELATIAAVRNTRLRLEETCYNAATAK